MAMVELNRICQACAVAGIGTKLDLLVTKLDANQAYDGELLTAQNVASINRMCKKAEKLELGTKIADILNASKNNLTVDALTDVEVAGMNNICAGMAGQVLGTTLQACITKINAMQDPAPYFVSAATSVDGATIAMTCSEAISATNLAVTGLAVKVGGVDDVISAIALDSDNASIVNLTLATNIAYGETITLAYTPGTIKGVDGQKLQAFAATNVTNNVPETPTE